MTSPFRFDGTGEPETEEERRKRQLREAMRAAQLGLPLASQLPAMTITAPRSSMLDASARRTADLTAAFESALAESERRRQSPLERLARFETPEVAPDVTAAPTGQTRRRPATISAAPEEESAIAKALNVPAQALVQPMLAGARFREAVESTPLGRLTPGTATGARRTQEVVEERFGPKSGLAQAVAIPAAFAGEVVPYVAAGGGIPGLLRSAAITGLTSQRPGGSTVEALGDLSGSETLKRLAESPLRTAADVGLDVGINVLPGAVRGLTSGFREAARATRGGVGTTRALARQAAQNVAEGARQIGPATRAIGQQLAAEPLTTAALAASVAGEVAVPGAGLLAAALPATIRRAGEAFPDQLFSRLERAITAAPFEKGTPQQWQAAISKGVAAGEREWVGIDDFLKNSQSPTLTKAEVLGQFEQGKVRLGETVLDEEAKKTAKKTAMDLQDYRKRVVNNRREEILSQDSAALDIDKQYNQVRKDRLDILEPLERTYKNDRLQALEKISKPRPDAPLSLADALGFDSPQTAFSIFADAVLRTNDIRAWESINDAGLFTDDYAKKVINRAIESYSAFIDTAEQLDKSLVRLGTELSTVYDRAERQAINELTQDGTLSTIDAQIAATKNVIGPVYGAYTQPGEKGNYREVVLTLDGQDATDAYKSSHWAMNNPLVHVRMTDRALPSGEKALFVEEIQSDWHQAGRKEGYKKTNETNQQLEELKALRAQALADGNEREAGFLAQEMQDIRDELRELGKAVPEAPFKKTQEWAELGLKRVIQEAVDKGYDRVVMVRGQQAADNFDLSRQINELGWATTDNGNTYILEAIERPSDTQMATREIAKGIPAKDLSDYVGKDVADRIVTASASAPNGTLRGVDLQVGGEGMKAFYDKIVPNTLRDLGKSMGLKIELEPVKLFTDGDNLSFRITPEVRQKVQTDGMRLYDITGVVPEAVARTITSPGMGAAVGAGVGALQEEEDRFGGAMRGALAGAAVGTAGRLTKQQLIKARMSLRAAKMPQELAESYALSKGSIDFSGEAEKAIANRAPGGFRKWAQRRLANYEDGQRELDRLAGRAEAMGMAPEESVATMLDRALGSQATAARALARPEKVPGIETVERGGVLDPNTREIVNEPLEDVFAVLGGSAKRNEQGLTYATAVRRVNRYDTAAAAGDANPLRVYGGDEALLAADRRVVEEFGKQEDIAEFAQRLQNFMDAIGQYAVKSGLWSPEQYAAMRESDALYIPFKRLLENVQGTVGRPMTRGGMPGQVTGGVKAFTGSNLMLANPAEAIGEYVSALIARSDRYRVGSSLIDTVKKLGDTNLLTPIASTDPRARSAAQAIAEEAYRMLGVSEQEAERMADLFVRVDRNNAVIWRNGPQGREYFLVNDPDLWSAVETLNPQNPDAAVQAIVGAIAPLKRMTTAFATGYAPSFWLGVNLPRDIITAVAQNPDMTVADMAYGFREAAKAFFGRSEAAERITREGAGQVTQFGGEPNVEAMMQRIAPTTTGLRPLLREAGRGVATPVRAFERAGRASEMPMRLAAARAARRTAAARGVSEAGQRALESRAYSKATVDFRRKAGNQVERFFEQTVPFYAAAKKGGVAFARATKDNPKTVGAVATGIVLATVMEHVLGGGTAGVLKGDEAKRQEQTNRLAWERARSIRVGDFKLALPQELAIVAAATRVALASLEDDDPFVYEQLKESILSAIPPVYSDVVGPLVFDRSFALPFPGIRQLQEIAQNRSAFTGRPIVPESMLGTGVGRGVLPAQRRYETTPATFDAMASAARALGMEEASPLQMEYLARGLTGRFTPAITAATDPLARQVTGRTTPETVPTPVMQQALNPLSSFVVSPARRTQAEEQFFKLRNRIENAQETYRQLDKRRVEATERGDAAGVKRVDEEVAIVRRDPAFEEVYQERGKRLEKRREKNPDYYTTQEWLDDAQDRNTEFRDAQQKIQEDFANKRITGETARKELQKINAKRSKLFRLVYDTLSERFPE
jgi:hypothetical protein